METYENENTGTENETAAQPYDGVPGTEDVTEAETHGTPEASSDIPEEAVEDAGKGLTDRLDALIEILTPEEAGDSENSAVPSPGIPDSSLDSSSYESDAASAQEVQELLESINGTLSIIKSGNVSYYADSYILQEESSEYLGRISGCVEAASVSLVVIGFFVALSCGNRFANTFFHRMKGD